MVTVTFATKPRRCAHHVAHGVSCGSDAPYRVRGRDVRFYCRAHVRRAVHGLRVRWDVRVPPRDVHVPRPYGAQQPFVPIRHVTAHPRNGVWRSR